MSEEMKAFSIKAADLSHAVDAAVADVLGKHDLVAGKGLAAGPGTLIGRMLRGAVTDMGAVQKAAAEVTAQVSKTLGAGQGQLSPAAFLSGGHIIVGFIAQSPVEF